MCLCVYLYLFVSSLHCTFSVLVYALFVVCNMYCVCLVTIKRASIEQTLIFGARIYKYRDEYHRYRDGSRSVPVIMSFEQTLTLGRTQAKQFIKQSIRQVQYILTSIWCCTIQMLLIIFSQKHYQVQALIYTINKHQAFQNYCQNCIVDAMGNITHP